MGVAAVLAFYSLCSSTLTSPGGHAVLMYNLYQESKAAPSVDAALFFARQRPVFIPSEARAEVRKPNQSSLSVR